MPVHFIKSLVLLSFLFCVSAEALPDLNQYLCPAQCNSTKAKSPFDFAKKAANFGDPNGKGSLGSTIQIPKTEDNSSEDGTSPSDSVNTSDFFSELNQFENWSAGTCGQNLNDPGDVLVAQPCAAVNDRYNRWKNIIIGKHKPTSPYHPPANKKAMDAYHEAASSPAAKEKLKTYMWIRNDGLRTHFLNCKAEGIDPENKNLFAIEIAGSMCSQLEAPKMNSVGMVGPPPGTYTKADIGGKASVYVFGHEFQLMGGTLALNSPSTGPVYRTTQFNYMGDLKVNDNNIAGIDSKYDLPLNLAHVHEGTSATFTIGPVPVTVEGGINGDAGVNFISRQTNLWANGRIQPGVNIEGYAKAYVNLLIVKAGVDAKILLLNDYLDIYAFSGVVASQVTWNGNTGNSFIFSEQISLANQINALNGNVAAFVKVAVPKFIGWKWKKYSTSLFSWGGISAKGYLYNSATDGMFIYNVPNNNPAP